MIGTRPGLDPADIHLAHGHVIPEVILRNMDVLTPTESSQGLLPDMDHKESIDIFYIS